MTTEKEQVDVECGMSLRLIVSMAPPEPSMTDTESVFIRVHPWQMSSFTVPIERGGGLWSIRMATLT